MGCNALVLMRKGIIPILIFIGMMNSVFAKSSFHLEKDAQGNISPFKAISIPLSEFIREYGRITATQLLVGGNWDQELKGTVTLFFKRPLNQEGLAEVFFRVLADNGYAAIDGATANTMMIERSRDARDDALPIYEVSEVPNSSRLVTAYRNLQFANAEQVSRMMRSFMPGNSRIIPTSRSQVFITDVASNIRKLNAMISKMDNPEVAKRLGEPSGSFWLPRGCGEQRIEKLIVEKLEIQDNSGSKEATTVKSVMSGGGKK